VSTPQELLRRYLKQRAELGEPPFILETAPRSDPATKPADLDRAPSPPTDEDAAVDPGPSRADTSPSPGTDPQRWMRDAPPVPGRGIVVAAPSEDLFTEDPLARLDLDRLADQIHACQACELGRQRTNAVPGEGPADARLVVVGEGPGATEDETGRPFVGRAGELLTDILAAIDLPREQVFICNVVKCRPPSNRKPLPAEVEACVPYLHRQLAILQPAVILAMGGTAAETLLNTRQSLGSLRNKVHEFRGIPLVVTYHPAALLRNPHWKKPTWDDVRIARQLVEQHG
jgi:uracil-DNA glycosylase family 4